MTIQIRKSSERGHFDHGWLDTYHTFSFGEYDDPSWRGFRSLRVINEDFIAPGEGFGMHPHRDMEIVTIVLEGKLRHQDNMGTSSLIVPGEVQRMSAGTGVLHSEFNDSPTEPLHLMQIWILPEREGLAPGYEQKTFLEEGGLNKLQLVAARNDSDGVRVHQDIRLFLSHLEAGKEIFHTLSAGRSAWIQIIRGEVNLNALSLLSGDGAAVSEESRLTLKALKETEFLLFDLA